MNLLLLISVNSWLLIVAQKFPKMIIIFGPPILYHQYITYNFPTNYAAQNYNFHLVDYQIAFFAIFFTHKKKTYQWFPLEVIEYNHNIMLNMLNTYPSALLSTIHLLKLTTLFQKTAYVFQLAMARQSDELNLRVVSWIRSTDALDLNFSQMTLVESFLQIFYFRKKNFILINIIHEKLSQFWLAENQKRKCNNFCN